MIEQYNPKEVYVTPDEACKLEGVSSYHIWKLINGGILPIVRYRPNRMKRGRWLIRKSVLEDYYGILYS